MPNVLKWMVIITVVALAGCAASAPEPVPPAASELANAERNDDSGELEEIEVQEIPIAQSTRSPDELICRREQVTGSHMQVRVCRTRAQIQEEQAEAQELIRGFGVFDGAGAGGVQRNSE